MTETSSATQEKPTLTLPTGEVFTGETWEEVAKKQAEALVNTKKWGQEQKAHAEELESQVRESSQTTQPQAGDGEYNRGRAEYWALVQAGKEDEAADLMDSYRYGIPKNEVREYVKNMFKNSERAGYSLQLNAFHNEHPDFPGGNEAAQKIFKQIEIAQAPVNAATMGMAYEALVRRGDITPLTLEEIENQGPKPAPALTGGGGNAQEQSALAEFEKLNKMSTAEMEAYLREKGMM